MSQSHRSQMGLIIITRARLLWQFKVWTFLHTWSRCLAHSKTSNGDDSNDDDIGDKLIPRKKQRIQTAEYHDFNCRLKKSPKLKGGVSWWRGCKEDLSKVVRYIMRRGGGMRSISMLWIACSHTGRDKKMTVRQLRGRSQTQGAVSVQCGVTWDENRSEKDTVDSSKRIAERKLREGVTVANYLKIEAVEWFEKVLNYFNMYK